MRIRRLADVAMLTVICALTVAGCARVGVGLSPPPVVDSHELELRQAHDALDRWAQAVTAAGDDYLQVPLHEGLRVVGELTPDEQRAVRSGALLLQGQGPVFAAEFPYEAGPRSIVWPDGRSLPVSPLSAGQALIRVAAVRKACPECKPLNVIDVATTTTEISTSRGPAKAPAWRYTLEGTSAILIALAVGEPVGVSPTPPPWDSVHPPAGRSIEGGTISTDDRHLLVSLVGAQSGADTPCGADYTAETIESDLAVVVIITVTTYPQLHPGHDGEICSLVGYPRTAPVDLDGPLGARAVLEVREGLPVNVIHEPTFSS